ncbi:hypothetical protein DW089_04740 [Acidaminococcus sp. AM05-11]|nr:hypothetical protein DW089_04740 [Acidaminococcus sp. AM05-11]
MESYIALGFFMLITAGILQFGGRLVQLFAAQYGQWELERAAQDLEARVGSHLEFAVDRVEIHPSLTGSRNGIATYGHLQPLKRSYYLNHPMKNPQQQLLYMASWVNSTRPGANPLLAPQLEIEDLKVEKTGPNRLRWRLLLSYPATGQKKQVEEVFRYGNY